MATPTKEQLQATARELGVSDEGGTRDLVTRIREAKAARSVPPAPPQEPTTPPTPQELEGLDSTLPTDDDGPAGLTPPAPPPPPTQSDPPPPPPPPAEDLDEDELVACLADVARRRSAGAAAVFAMAFAPDGEVLRAELAAGDGPDVWHRAEELVAIAGGGDLEPAVVIVEPGAGRVRLASGTVDVDVGRTI